MINSADNTNFKARMVFKFPNKTVKPYVLANTRPASTMNKTLQYENEPGFIPKLLFGIRKHTKIPSLKNDMDISNSKSAKYLSSDTYKFLEKGTIALEYGFRKIVNSFTDILAKSVLLFKRDKKETPPFFDKDKVKEIPENSATQMLYTYTMSKLMSAGKEVEINIENDELLNILNTNESTIFIMNHDRQKEDPKLLNFFNALLSREYIYNDRAESCPKPKIVLNKDILNSASEAKQIMGKKWGAVGIDAAIYSANHLQNGKTLVELIKGLVEDKINLFIFPEGRMCAFKNMSPQWKFQSGIADIIKAVVQRKENVRVVPLGFAYKGKVGSIRIGKPLYFKQEGQNMLFKDGIIDPTFQDKKFVEFMQNSKPREADGYHVITESGKSVSARDSKEYISGILCENLTANKKLAAEQIKNVGTEMDNSEIYVLGEN